MSDACGGVSTFQRYVAIGDSQSEGMLDHDGRGGFRGWADRFAEFVAAAGSPALQYANLAVRGRRLAPMRAEQLAPAQAMRPDLVTVMGGLNDLLRSSADLDAAVAELDAMLGGFPQATVLTNTFPDLTGVAPFLARVAPRVESFNAAIREVAAARGAIVVDFAARGVGSDRRIWSPDRIHATAVGHALMASAFADSLGLPGFTGWDTPLPPAVRSPVGRVVDDTGWLVRFLLPWLYRGLRGRSSGDGVSAKRPQLLPVAALFHLVDPQAWASCGDTLRPPSLSTEGFVHLSFADQVEGSANRHCSQASSLVALEVDPVLVGSQVRVEDSYDSGTSFPHVYGPLPRAAVTAVHPMSRAADGSWQFDRTLRQTT